MKKRELSLPTLFRIVWVPLFSSALSYTVDMFILIGIFFFDPSKFLQVFWIFFFRRQGEKTRGKVFAVERIKKRLYRSRNVQTQLKFIKIYYSSFFMALLEAERWNYLNKEDFEFVSFFNKFALYN